MKNSEIKELSVDELKARLRDEKANLSKLKFTHAVSALENPNVLGASRKVIARINTELSSRKLAEVEQTAAEEN